MNSLFSVALYFVWNLLKTLLRGSQVLWWRWGPGKLCNTSSGIRGPAHDHVNLNRFRIKTFCTNLLVFIPLLSWTINSPPDPSPLIISSFATICFDYFWSLCPLSFLCQFVTCFFESAGSRQTDNVVVSNDIKIDASLLWCGALFCSLAVYHPLAFEWLDSAWS